MTRTVFSDDEWSNVSQGVRTAAATAFALACGVLTLSLASYSPADPGPFVATWREAANWLGTPGAYLADLTFRTLGVASYVVAVLAAIWAARLFIGSAPARFWAPIFAAPFGILFTAVVASTHEASLEVGGGYGGILGDMGLAALVQMTPFDDRQASFVAGALLALICAAPLMAIAAGFSAIAPLTAPANAVRNALNGSEPRRPEPNRDVEPSLSKNPFVAEPPEGFAGDDAPDDRRARRAPRLPRDAQTSDALTAALAAARRAADAAPQWSGELDTDLALSSEPEVASETAWTPSIAPQKPPTTSARHAHELVEPGFSPAHSPRVDGDPPEQTRLVASFEAAAPQPDAPRAPDLSEAVSFNCCAAPILLFAKTASKQGGETRDEAADFAAASPDPRPALVAHHPPLADAITPAPVTVSLGGGGAAADVGARGVGAPLAATFTLPGDAWSLAGGGDWNAAPTLAPAPSPAPETPPAAEPEPAAHFEPQTGYVGPPLSLLSGPRDSDAIRITEQALAEQADRLQAVLNDYGVRGEIIDVNPGPVVSQFELEPAPGLKASRIVGLADDIARSMSAVAARISTIPGRNIIGVELPNAEREMVRLRPLFEDASFQDDGARLPLALGRDIAGAPVVADLATMPHLLIAGTTGSGKSVAINTMILSLLFKRTPEECRLILIDPKMLELSVYNDTPHLLAPVVTEPKKAVRALRWVVREMERRYQIMAQLNVRSLDSYNERIAQAAANGDALHGQSQVGVDPESGEPITERSDAPLEKLPLIVVIIDEMADLMLVAGKEIEHCIQRLAQMARASGIHLIMATQRPSVDVITGVIKANFPIRISFQVTSKIDSRTILGEGGAEQLLGKGDMLFTAGGGRLQRIHGPFASDVDVDAVASHLRALGPAKDVVNFDDDAEDAGAEDAASEGGEEEGGSDDLIYDRAVRLVVRERRASTSFLQRRLQLGYNRAARIIDMMEQNGVVSAANHVGKREVLAETAP